MLNGYGTVYDKANSTLYYGIFVDNSLQGAGYTSNITLSNVQKDSNFDASIGEAWGYFEDFELVETYGYHELSLEEKVAYLKEQAAGIEYINNLTSQTMSSIQASASQSEARILEYKKNLQKAAPRPQVKLAPNYGGIINPDGSFVIGN
jgi:hypothetical protein